TSGAQVRAISGLLECLNHHVIQDRSCAADLVADAATLMRVASAWPSATDDSANVIETLADSGGSASLDELKLAADTVAALLLQLRTNVRAISATGGWGVHASAVDRAMAPINEAAAQFDGAHSTLASASSLVVSFGTAGIDGRTADACASAYAHIRKARHAVSLAARAIIDALSGSDLDPRVLGPWVGPTTEAADLVVSLCSAAAEPTAVAEQVGDMSGFAALAGRWVTGVMGVWQAIHAAETQYPANAAERERNVWGFTPKELVRKLAVLQATAKALRLPLMIPVLRDLTLQRRTQSTVQQTGGEIDRCVQPWVLQYSLMVQHVVSMYADVHQSVVHFALGMAVSLTSVIAHGMGPQGDSIAEPEDSGNTSTQTGTGMGEGSTAGAKNVSDEIEGEDQVEGLRDDAAADEENEPDTNEDAVDMQNDFEGKMGDADLETDDSDSDKSDDSDDEDQEMDEQMGDVDPTDPTALDEKLWDDEKDGDDENKDSAKDADETVDSKAKQSKPDTDIVAGQEEAEDDDKQQDKDGDTKEPAGQGEDEGSDDEMQSDGDDEGSGDDELDDRINKDTLDRMADVDDLGEQLEMPDDLDMDNQDNEEEDDGIEADMAGDDLPEDEPIDQKPDAAMDEDSAEKANDNEDADNAVEGEDGEKADDDNGMVDDELDGDVSDMGGEDADGSDQDDEADQSGDEPGEEEEDDEEEKGRENALIDEDSQLNKKEEEATGADNPTGGLDSAMNLDGNDEANPDAAAESQDAVDKPSNSNEQQQHQKSQPDANGIAQQQQQQQSPDQTREQGEEEEDSNKRSMDSERTLADVIEKWERRLNIIMREDEPAPTNEAEPEPSSDDKDEAAKKQNDNSSSGDQQPAPESSEFEHVKEDEDFDKVALADANDEELEKQQHQPMDIDEDDNDGQQQQPLQQQTATPDRS
ncbi:AAA ATPase midasin, partial [Coemansia sp. RSA 2399]